jgi:hypothetical protein
MKYNEIYKSAVTIVWQEDYGSIMLAQPPSIKRPDVSIDSIALRTTYRQ